MRFIILTLFIIAAMSFVASFALVAEGEYLWAVLGGAIGFVSFRFAGWFDHHYKF